MSIPASDIYESYVDSIKMCMGEWPSAPTYVSIAHQFTGRYMEIHFVSLRFEPALGNNLFIDSAGLPFSRVLCQFTKVFLPTVLFSD